MAAGHEAFFPASSTVPAASWAVLSKPLSRWRSACFIHCKATRPARQRCGGGGGSRLPRINSAGARVQVVLSKLLSSWGPAGLEAPRAEDAAGVLAPGLRHARSCPRRCPAAPPRPAPQLPAERRMSAGGGAVRSAPPGRPPLLLVPLPSFC